MPKTTQKGVEDLLKPATPKKEEKEVVAKNGYVVPQGEEDLYHVELSDKVQFDPYTGKKIAKSFVQKYNIKIWRTIYDSLITQGYNITILHDPTK